MSKKDDIIKSYQDENKRLTKLVEEAIDQFFFLSKDTFAYAMKAKLRGDYQ